MSVCTGNIYIHSNSMSQMIFHMIFVFQDGMHEMFIYRCDERAKLQPAHYLGLPSCAREVTIENNSNSFFSRSHKESVTIRTLLCSTKLTQNGL